MLARLKSEVKEVTVRIKDEVGEVKARIRSMSDREEGEVDLVEEEIVEDEEDLQEAALNEAQLLLVTELIRLRGLVKNWEGQGALCLKVLEHIRNISALETEISDAGQMRDKLEEEGHVRKTKIEEARTMCTNMNGETRKLEEAYSLVLKARTSILIKE